MLGRLDPQAKALLEQLATSAARETQPELHLLLSYESLYASTLTLRNDHQGTIL